MTMKNFSNNLRKVRSAIPYFFPFVVSTFTNRAVLISIGLIVGGGLGWSVAGIIQLVLFHFFGSATLGYTTLPILIFMMAVLGGIVSFLISHFMAADRFFKPKIEPIKENPIPAQIPIATLAAAPVLASAPLAVKLSNHKFPFKIPAGREWENIILKFLDDENVLIIVGKWRHRAGYADMDMADTREKEPKPNMQWHFLKILADFGGEVGFGKGEARTSFKKQKSILTQKLKDYFDMGGDPFWPYNQFGTYKIRMTLVALYAPDGKPMVTDIKKEALLADDGEPMPEGIPEPISDDEEDKLLIETILDEQDAVQNGLRIRSGR
jgi:hypothetical protein